jgi:hypothetical protein
MVVAAASRTDDHVFTNATASAATGRFQSHEQAAGVG